MAPQLLLALLALGASGTRVRLEDGAGHGDHHHTNTSQNWGQVTGVWHGTGWTAPAVSLRRPWDGGPGRLSPTHWAGLKWTAVAQQQPFQQQGLPRQQPQLSVPARPQGRGAAKEDCTYHDLKDVSFSVPSSDEVDMTFCGRTQRLRHSQNEELFKDIRWWDPELAGRKLSPIDVKHIKLYTGSFTYSRNMGMLLRGIAPLLNGEDPSTMWEETSDRARLAREVLDFAMRMGDSLNKLPAPDSPTKLYRGAWVPQSTADLILSKPRGVKLPWFQPTTTKGNHTYLFMADRLAPDRQAIPLRFTFHTTRAKNVSKWNAAEQEHIILPNLPFDVTSAERVVNDPFIVMSTEELSDWLNSSHALPNWMQQEGSPESAGPWPEAAKAVLSRRISGPEFARAAREGVETTYTLMGLLWDLRHFYWALKARYQLAWLDREEPHSFPFYVVATLVDAEL